MKQIGFSGRRALALLLAVAIAATTRAQVTQRVSLSTYGDPGNDFSRVPSISADGRFVAFWSAASNLVPDHADTNMHSDIFVRDRQLGTTERVSVDSTGAQGNDECDPATQISSDGRFVTFLSKATNLVAGDTNGFQDVFVHDRSSGATEVASVASDGTLSNGYTFDASISDDGRFVAFGSDATNLVPVDLHNFSSIFLRDRVLATTELVSVSSSGIPGDGNSGNVKVSADGRYVAFDSDASNLVLGNANGKTDVFVRDRQAGTTELVSIAWDGSQSNGDMYLGSISADGRYVVISGFATNLVPGDTNGVGDVFVRDRWSGTLTRASVTTTGIQANGGSTYGAIASGGRFVAFESSATNLAPPSIGMHHDVYVHDLDSSGFSSICDRSIGGVIACPCSNSPSGPGRGCDNSSATGGAIIAASGIAYLSMDSLVFTTSAEKPTATSIVMQGNSLAATGLVFGQGVRCVGGSLKRLYTKTASGGSITAPQAGDPTASARSAALGDPISAGQSRWYLVYYRDPIVLGGCPASSTFNATQTARIDWSL